MMRKKNTEETRLNAGITVFCALTVTVIFALLLSVLESARTSAARLHLQITANSSADSLFSQYHRRLWEDYRLLGLEQYDFEQLTDEMQDFAEPYLKAENWFPMSFDSIDITELKLITDENGEIFENEVLDYMKYGIAAEIWELSKLAELEKSCIEGSAVDELSGFYENHAELAADIEKTLSEITAHSEAAKLLTDDGKRALYACDGERFIDCASDAEKRLDKIPGLVKKYEKQADRLKRELEKSESELEQKLSSGELSRESWNIINEDIEQYESYVEADGSRRQEAVSAGADAEKNSELLNELSEEAEEILEYIAEWEPDDEDDELDEEALWRPVIANLGAYRDVKLKCNYGMKDEESEKKLESVKAVLDKELLRLVLPKDAAVNTESFDLTDSPGSLHFENEITRLGLSDRAYTAQYIVSEFGYFGRGIYNNDKAKGSGGCETEYILCGENSDSENLSGTVTKLSAFRTGMNLMFLYSDSRRKGEARSLAAAITGAVGFTPLIPVITFLILGTWAKGQAIIDVKNLLAGGKVPIIHNNDSFRLTLENLMNFSDTGIFKEDGTSGERDSGSGLEYKDYLKIFLLTLYSNKNAYRAMDMIQLNICGVQKDFRMDRLVYSMSTELNVKAAHVFSELDPVKRFGLGTDKGYSMKAAAAFSY